MSSPSARSSTLSTTKPLRPTTRPLRTKNTWTAASSSSSAIPMTSRSSPFSTTICWRSMALRTAASRSRTRAARSNSSSAAAAAISCSSRRTIVVGVAVEERRAGPRPARRRLALDLPDARAASTSRCGTAGRAGPACGAARACCRSRCGWGRCAAAGRGSRGWRRRGRRARSSGPPCALAPHHHGAGPLVADGDGQERVALVVHQADVEPGPVLLDQRVLQHERLDVVADLDPLDGLGRGHHLGRAGRQVPRVLEVVRQALAQRLGLADVDHPAVDVLELVAAGRVGDGAGRGTLTTAPGCPMRLRAVDSGRPDRCPGRRRSWPVLGSDERPARRGDAAGRRCDPPGEVARPTSALTRSTHPPQERPDARQADQANTAGRRASVT